MIVLELLVFSLKPCLSQDPFWEIIKEKTWYTADIGLGQSLTLFENDNGDKKAVIQQSGSGMPTINLVSFDVFIKHNTLYFRSGDSTDSDFKVFERLTLEIEGNQLSSADGETVYKMISDEAIVRKPNGDIINMDSLRMFFYDYQSDQFLTK